MTTKASTLGTGGLIAGLAAAVAAGQTTAPAATESWKVVEGPRLPSARGSHAAAVIDHKVMVVGGEAWNAEKTVKSFLSDVLIFEHDRWTHPYSLPFSLAEAAYASDGKALYLAGGRRALKEVTDEVYCLRSGSKLDIEKLPSLPIAVAGAGAAVLDNHLYVVCGFTNDKPLNGLYSLDLVHRDAGWKQLSSLPGDGRTYSAFSACGNTLYVLGGLKGNESESNNTIRERTLSDIYRYDPHTDRWKASGQLPVAGYAWSASPVDDTHLLLAGRGDGVIHDDIWLLDVTSMKAQQIGRSMIATDCAPLIQVKEKTWWLLGGEPDLNKNRTDRISAISRQSVVVLEIDSD